ncbi:MULTISPECIES: hypothetical protein [unclassified Pseudoalteromonas]|jgi:hypothetical protein|uniref:Uncharacterized protein n=1 Tax=Pseudoalteromonas sp. SD03 TaxID=3231719 RepID=A0AB39ARW6_9GAMM|nr:MULTISPECIES: hypothetical protein [unclassified Pseudoalteromonas]MDN3414538.1 hypothetical protein [Pseudoalteromonas sp. APC 3250]TMS61599.1 hypothetical protein CWC10_11075 [Pseudoalteromonas sp. S3173]|tara:strand:- start:77 stop:634 length:558 start_codon:yes stop_codon:yes gene_type:complete
MANDHIDLDELIGEKFLETLDDKYIQSHTPERPSWVIDDENHTTYKSWQIILVIKEEKEENIKKFGKVANNKTQRSLYKILKSEVAEKMEISSQSIFRTSKFSPSILKFFDEINIALLELYEKEQIKQRNRQKNTGIRSRKKQAIVRSHQDIENELNQLKARTTKEVLDLAIDKMPLDYRLKLGL